MDFLELLGQLTQRLEQARVVEEDARRKSGGVVGGVDMRFIRSAFSVLRAGMKES